MADRARINRTRRFGLGLVLALLMTVGFWPVNVTTGNASPGRKGPIFDIIPTSAAIPAGTISGTFVLTGDVYPYGSVNKSTCVLLTTVSASDDRIGSWVATVVVTPQITTVSPTTPPTAGPRFQMHHTIILDSLPGIIEVQGINGLVALNGGRTPADPNFPLGPTTGPSEIQTITGGASRYEGLDGSASIRPYCGPVPTFPPTQPPAFRFDRAFCLGVSSAVD